MKKLSVLIAAFLLGIVALSAQMVQHNLEAILDVAKEEQKNVLMIFSGSDWCKNCIQLQRNILSSEDFQTYSVDKWILLEVDFPYQKKNRLPKEQQTHNEVLAERYNPEGVFPTIILLNQSGQVIGQSKYNKNDDVARFIEKLEGLL